MLPPGRKPVRTLLYSEGQRQKAWQLVGDELKAGRQVYIVYPLVEESEKVDLKAAIQGADYLQRDVFPRTRVGLLHGRLKRLKRRTGGLQGRVNSDSRGDDVIEVGVDVPNATVMVIDMLNGLAWHSCINCAAGSAGALINRCVCSWLHTSREKPTAGGP